MSGRKAPSESLLARAAELRALGYTWDATAKTMKRSPHTISKWPHFYPERWAAALEQARRRTVGDLSIEALVALRKLLRDNDGKLSLHAARYLSDLRLEQARFDLDAGADAPQPPLLALKIAHMLETYTPEELAELADCADRIIVRRRDRGEQELPARAA
jgi:hypothetical protein